MTGVVCLQGGAELQPGCREMDAEVLRLAPSTRVAVLPLAAAPGRQYDVTGREGVRYYSELGAEAVVSPDARADLPGALDCVRSAGLVVLPGGSPSRLLAAVQGPLGELLRERWLAGTALSGASAGAMVLGSWTALPERRPLGAAPGLGVVPVGVLPHWSGGRGDWLAALEPAGTVLGLPEQSGVIVAGDRVTAVGARASEVLRPLRRRLERGVTAQLSSEE